MTAWESLFDRLRLSAGSRGTLLVLGAAGGVGSILIQLARQPTELTIIGAASRPESQAWVREMGAHEVIDYRDGFDSLADSVDYVFTAFSVGRVEAFASMLHTRTERWWRSMMTPWTCSR